MTQRNLTFTNMNPCGFAQIVFVEDENTSQPNAYGYIAQDNAGNWYYEDKNVETWVRHSAKSKQEMAEFLVQKNIDDYSQKGNSTDNQKRTYTVCASISDLGIALKQIDPKRHAADKNF